ncbi:hypothetical protein OHA98_41155 [Streptomyces sp. NBC_00654]|uniref:hypothetical protein n=1 Tax=Streptomyces sp. NBC_00654 TaxID=2975799 RepID=UPI00224E8384|nr:hypothetical protein [Streptomyces sp. NBC_00654]MCX4971025.1 hypothetical protein [Streptomyces sp. NBC_00654]
MTDLPTMTGPEAYSRAVEHALRAAAYAEGGSPASARTHAAVAQAFAAIATAEATARSGARGWPAGGWADHTHPDRF